jgi:hypothetical protein
MKKSVQVVCGALVLAFTAEAALAQNTPLRVPAMGTGIMTPACQAAVDQAMFCIKAIEAGTSQCSLAQSNALNAHANQICGAAPQAPPSTPTTRSQPQPSDSSGGKGLPR